MSSLTFPTPQPNNPFEIARRALISALVRMEAPKAFTTFPVPSEFTGVIDHMRQAAGLFDEWLAAIGHQVADNSSGNVDMRLFRSAFTDAIDGNAMWEVEKQGEALIEDHNEMLRSA
jgi:hypothetical protein